MNLELRQEEVVPLERAGGSWSVISVRAWNFAENGACAFRILNCRKTMTSASAS